MSSAEIVSQLIPDHTSTSVKYVSINILTLRVMCVYMNFQLYGSVKQIVCFIAGQQDASFGSHFDQQDC